MGVTPTSCQFIHPHIMVPILQSPGLPERAGEARRADSASGKKVIIGQKWALRVMLAEKTLRMTVFGHTITILP